MCQEVRIFQSTVPLWFKAAAAAVGLCGSNTSDGKSIRSTTLFKSFRSIILLKRKEAWDTHFLLFSSGTSTSFYSPKAQICPSLCRDKLANCSGGRDPTFTFRHLSQTPATCPLTSEEPHTLSPRQPQKYLFQM